MPSAGITSFEHRRQRLLSRRRFASRMLKVTALWCILASVGLAIGMAGYAGFESMSLPDSYVNAAMILSGMGPMGELKTTAGKVFAGLTEIGGIEHERRYPRAIGLYSAGAEDQAPESNRYIRPIGVRDPRLRRSTMTHDQDQ